MKFLKPAVHCIILGVLSCVDTKSDLVEIVNNFAHLECRAISLREERFALANRIRSTEDSLLRRTDKTDTVRLKSTLEGLMGEKERLRQKSLTLADTIQSKLKTIMSDRLSNSNDKAKFNEMLNSKLEELGCIKD